MIMTHHQQTEGVSPLSLTKVKVLDYHVDSKLAEDKSPFNESSYDNQSSSFIESNQGANVSMNMGIEVRLTGKELKEAIRTFVRECVRDELKGILSPILLGPSIA